MYLHDLNVDPSVQRSGVGRQLVERAKAVARKWPVDAIRLDAYDGPSGGGPFYRKCGFHQVGRVVYRGVPLVYFEFVLRGDRSGTTQRGRSTEVTDMGSKAHWETIYKTKRPDQVSWFQQEASMSLALIRRNCSLDSMRSLSMSAVCIKRRIQWIRSRPASTEGSPRALLSDHEQPLAEAMAEGGPDRCRC